MCPKQLTLPSSDTSVRGGTFVSVHREFGEVVNLVAQNYQDSSAELPLNWQIDFLRHHLYRPLLQIVAVRHEAHVIPQIILHCTRDLCHTSPAIAAALMEPDYQESRHLLLMHQRQIAHVRRRYRDCIDSYHASQPRS